MQEKQPFLVEAVYTIPFWINSFMFMYWYRKDCSERYLMILVEINVLNTYLTGKYSPHTFHIK